MFRTVLTIYFYSYQLHMYGSPRQYSTSFNTNITIKGMNKLSFFTPIKNLVSNQQISYTMSPWATKLTPEHYSKTPRPDELRKVRFPNWCHQESNPASPNPAPIALIVDPSKSKPKFSRHFTSLSATIFKTTVVYWGTTS